ncbi:MAG: phosphohydrolase [Thermoprotei archaeon]|nr:MAG: phosphohydrolase [Thermoprotei archaeon]
MKIAFKLAEDFEEVDPLVLKLAVLLHDVGRVEEETLHKHHAVLSAEIARKLLVQYGFSQEIIEKVVDTILAHSFTLKYTPKTIEGKILSDADKLDALGAIGIMRVFMESAYRGRTLEEAINHFYEKLFKLKDLMWTEKAKKMAEERHKFMVYFLDRLEKEIEAEK